MDLKSMLDAKAEEMRLDRHMPRSVLRRARRRRAGNAILAGAVTVGLALGAFVGARALLDETTSAPPEIRPGGTTEEVYPFVFPATLEQLEVTQEQVAQGSIPLWTEPEGVAILFAVNVMGWRMEDVEVDVETDEPVVAAITNPALSDIPTRLTLTLVEGKAGPDDDIYAVLSAETEAVTVNTPAPGDPVIPGSRVVFVGRLHVEDPGLSVDVTLEWVELSTGSGAAGGSASFRRPVRIPPEIEGEPVARVAVHEGTSDLILALTSFRLGAPTGSAMASAGPPVVAVPGAVAETRDAILDAAQARDFEALRALIPDQGFTFSFGGDTDPIRYWKRLESEGHVPVIGDVLPSVLGTEPGFDRGVFVWPAQATEDPADWDEADIEALTAIHARQDIRSFQEAGLYLGWRVGIDRRGIWVFFVSGD